ncbi:MAG TPA: PQQ-binding-like beta-propeller repeat protein [Vicinamibacterales bacterium]|jgi:quinoprotein glucose dehydrogenase
MSRTLFRTIVAAALLIGALSTIAPRLTGQTSGQPSTKNGDWPAYTADLRGSKYSPLDQINAQNFNKLEVAWRFKTDSLGPRPEYKLEGTPLVVKGVMYTTGGTRRSVVALDARTGELMWAYSFREGNRAAIAPRQLSGRGVAYWTDGRGDERVIFVTTGYRMVELNAKTGQPVASFGKNGILDLKEGVVYGNRQPIDPETGEIGLHSTPTVVNDTVIVGSSFKEGFTVVTHNNTKGLVRGFDVRTGKTIWTFNTIPRPGELGNDSWENDSWAVNGNTGVWTQITADPEAGLAYLPVESPTSDLYGGHRPGNNLYGESLVAVDLKTGVRKWHFQFVHHPIWDIDMSSAPLLIDTTVEGRPRKLVAVPSKVSWLYVFDRISGAPIWPIEERAVPQSDVPGEKTARTQPHPTRPPAYARQYLDETKDLIDFTPEMRAQALQILKRYKNGPLFNPPIVGSNTGLIGAINIGNAGGGTNWPGGSFDGETGIVYVQANNAGVSSFSVRKPPAGFSDITYVSGREGTEFREALGPGFGTAADSPLATRPQAPATPPPPAAQVPQLNVEGLPLVKPPYGVLSAINLERGDLMWQVPHGDTPDNIRNHPKLQGMNIGKTGQAGSVGLMVTKTLVVLGDPLVTAPPGRPRGAMLRGYDKKTGQEVGAVLMPAPQSGSPMTYSVDGRQYMVVAVSGGNYSGEYIAFALPQNEIRSTNQQQH